MRPGEAVMKLTRMGFRFRLESEAVKFRFEGGPPADSAMVSLLLALLRQHKDEVRYFLRSYCPRCGGVVSCPDYERRPMCLACDWAELTEIYPALRTRH
jgi:ribosomal protein S27AE